MGVIRVEILNIALFIYRQYSTFKPGLRVVFCKMYINKHLKFANSYLCLNYVKNLANATLQPACNCLQVNEQVLYLYLFKFFKHSLYNRYIILILVVYSLGVAKANQRCTSTMTSFRLTNNNQTGRRIESRVYNWTKYAVDQ